MDGARPQALSRVHEVISAWLAGDYDTVTAGCTPDVRWWTPVSGETVSGPLDAAAELQRVIGPLRRPIEITAVVSNEDGTRCVVESRTAVSAQDPRPAFVTSVLTLRDGRISAGRTYVDINAHDLPVVEAP